MNYTVTAATLLGHFTFRLADEVTFLFPLPASVLELGIVEKVVSMHDRLPSLHPMWFCCYDLRVGHFKLKFSIMNGGPNCILVSSRKVNGAADGRRGGRAGGGDG